MSNIRSYEPRSPMSPAGSTKAPALSVGLVVHTLRQWWLVIIPVGLVLAATAAFLVYFFHVPEYTASHLLQFRGSDNLIGKTGRAPQSFEDKVQLLQSPPVLQAVLSKTSIAKSPELQGSRDPIKKLEKGLSVKSVGRSTFYRVEYTSTDPKFARDVANEVVSQFLKLDSTDSMTRESQLVSVLENEREVIQGQIRNLDNQQRLLVQDLAGTDYTPPSATEDPTSPVFAQLRALESTLAQRDYDTRLKFAELDAFRSWTQDHPVEVTDADLDAALKQHPQVQQFENMIKALEEDLAEYQTTAKDPSNSPGYQRMERRIDDLREQLATRRDELKVAIKDDVAKRIAADRDIELARLQNAYNSAKLSKDIVSNQLDEELQEAKLISSDQVLKLEKVRAELTQLRQVDSMMSSKLLEINVNNSAAEEVVTRMEAALPKEPDELIPFKPMLMAGGVMFVIPFGLALLWEMRIRRVSDTAQLEQGATVPVVGEIAALPLRRRISLTNRESGGLRLFEESIDSLRTSLIVNERLRDKQVFAICSATSQEGKTSVASQLAVSLARSTGEKTLLIDGDMRSPDIHNIFDVDDAPGLVEVLKGNEVLEEVIVPSWSEHLHILPAGVLETNPHKLVGGNRISALLKEVRKHYRYVVIDTPPLLAASEALLMAKSADASLVCAMRNYSRMDQVRAAYTRLENADASPVGVILSGVPTKKYAYYYGKYSYAQS